MTEDPNPTVPSLEPGDIYIYAGDDGSVCLTEAPSAAEFVTLDQACDRVLSCASAGHEVLVSGGDAPLATASLERIRHLGVHLTVFDAPVPPMSWSNGTTLLMHAVDTGRVDLVSDLLARGADVNVRNQHGWAAIDYALARHPELEPMLVAAGAPPRTPIVDPTATINLRSRWNAGVLYTPIVVAMVSIIGAIVIVVMWHAAWSLVLLALYVFIFSIAFPWAAIKTVAQPISLTGSRLTVRNVVGRERMIDLSKATLAIHAKVPRTVIQPGRQDSWLMIVHPEGRTFRTWTLSTMNANPETRELLRAAGGTVLPLAVSAWREKAIVQPIAAALHAHGVAMVENTRAAR